jgi:hypothetical protein
VRYKPAAAKCSTTIYGQKDFQEYYEPNQAWFDIKDPFERILYWQTVSSVTQEGSTVTIRHQRLDSAFYFPSEALAKRAAFAMEFLRTQCDPTANLAF